MLGSIIELDFFSISRNGACFGGAFENCVLPLKFLQISSNFIKKIPKIFLKNQRNFKFFLGGRTIKEPSNTKKKPTIHLD
jgi:hypothetical protein